MATPSSAPRAPAVSTPTPKANHGSTPSATHLTSPAAVAMARQFSSSHRSPSIKTPGHSHNMSATSQPSAIPLGASSTPLSAIHLADDHAAFNSPAAALLPGLIGQMTGLTPAAGLTPMGLGGVADGLGISNSTPDLHLSSSHLETNGGVKDPDMERDRRMNEIITMLRARVSGRGVCREAVERVAQLVGFTLLWQDDTITIAGNCVDLEIEFHHDSDRVRDVSLKIAINADVETEWREEASKILKSDLAQEEGSIGWKGLERFSSNLELLGRTDKLSQNVNCFGALEGLYESFQKIWAEEKKRMRTMGPLKRLARGVIGRPVMNKRQDLGLALEYWSPKVAFTEAVNPSDANAIETEKVSNSDEAKHPVWRGRIECEEGFPSVRVSKDWVSTDALQSAKEDDLTRVLPDAWLDPPPTLSSQAEQAMETDPSVSANFAPQQPNVRFVFEFDPEVLLPLAVAPNALASAGVTLVKDGRNMRDIRDQMSRLLTPSKEAARPDPQGLLKWQRSIAFVGVDNIPRDEQYIINFRTNGPIWCCPVQSIAFDHPRQLANLLPVLRQYATLWTLLESSTNNLKSDGLSNSLSPVSPSNVPAAKHSRAPKKRSNVNAQRTQLAELLKDEPQGFECPSIDVTLGFLPGHQPQPTLDLRFPLYRHRSGIPSGSPAFGCICVEIGLGGQIQVTTAENLPFAKSTSGRQKLSRILEVSEDVTVLVAYVHERLEQSSGNP